jgi:N-acetylglucosamine-6-phosphate deacetylase
MLNIDNQTFAIENGKFILPEAIVVDKSLVIEKGKIGAMVNADLLPSKMPKFDAKGQWVAPGFIDIHVHGADGVTFNDVNNKAYQKITEAHLKHGVTSLLATIATAPLGDMLNALAFVKEWCNSQTKGSKVLGAHLEGPFFSKEQAGAQDIQNLLIPDQESIRKILDHNSILKIVSLAPELPNAMMLIQELTRLGITSAAGHSSARDADLITAIAHGLRHVIHIWNAQSMTIREGVWRKPGLVEATLVSEDLSVEMICDNKHLPPTLMKLAIKAIRPDKLCLISDATAGAGLENGAHFTMGMVEYKVKDGVGMTLDETSFAGSTTFLNQMLKVVVEETGVSLTRAVGMCSLNPAKVLGIDHQRGSISPGKNADMVILDNEFDVVATILDGSFAYMR